MDEIPELEDPTCDPKKPRILVFCNVKHARTLIEPHVVKTPCLQSRLSMKLQMNLFLKAEFMQHTGSFKERGARYALMKIPEEKKKFGAVAASAGNHAQAMCYHGNKVGISITVVMPETAAIMKIQRCKDFGANVVVKGKSLSESKRIAMAIAKDTGASYINGYDNPDVLAGQGTVGIEILEQVPDVNVIVVPVGGGSLLAGVTASVKKLKACVKVVGVESESCNSFANGLSKGAPVFTPAKPTLADGLAVPTVGYNSLVTVMTYGVDKMISVTEEDIAVAILRLMENEKFVVEGAGATSLAAVLSGQLDEYKGQNIVLVLTGGNIDTTTLSRCLERGLAADGRLVKIYVTISDRPGGAAELYQLIASLGVTIKQVQLERAWITFDVFSVYVKAVCETRNFAHALELEHLLRQHYKQVDLVHAPFPISSDAVETIDTYDS